MKSYVRNLWNKDLVQKILNDLNLDVSVSTFKGNNLISLKNKHNIRVCPIGGEENKNDNAFLIIKDNKLHYHCHDEGCKGKSKVIHQFEEDSRIIELKLLDEVCKSNTNADCAELFKFLYGHNIEVICKKDKLNFYHWNNDNLLWEQEPSETMVGLIDKILSVPTERRIKSLFTKMTKAEDPTEKVMLAQELKNAQIFLKSLKTTSFLKNTISYYMSYRINKDFETKIINRTAYELPIKNGLVIDLRTLITRKRTRKDFWSVECDVNYNPDIDLSDVHTFMNSITCDSKDLKDYHRRLWGYMITGEISDRSLHIFWGSGCNGKSSIVNIFKAIMGDLFSVSLSEDVMLSKKSSRGASPEMMDLLYSRCGIMPESEKKERINSKRVKTITGDDDIKARHLYGHLVQFRSQCKAIFPTNHKPLIDVEDQAILDRLKLVPFLGRFEKNDTNTKYIKHLQENCKDQFFTWFCSGSRDWYDGSELIPCLEMKDEMNKYIIECDVIAEFVDDTYDIISEKMYNDVPKLEKAKYRTERSIIYGMFMSWINENNKKDESMSKKEFYNSLNKKYVVKKRSKVFYLLKDKTFYGEEEEEEEGGTVNLPL